jgi:hypothetical protein
MKIYLLLCLAFVSSITLFSSNALACACCAERGEYSIRTLKTVGFGTRRIERIQFATANLYTTAGYPEDIKGHQLARRKLFIERFAAKQFLEIHFKDRAGKTGNAELDQTRFRWSRIWLTLTTATRRAKSFYTKNGVSNIECRTAREFSRTASRPRPNIFLFCKAEAICARKPKTFKNWRLEITGKKAITLFSVMKSPAKKSFLFILDSGA